MESEKGIEMSALPYESHEEGWDSYREDEDLQLPGRPRRRFLNWGSAALLAVAVGAIGFYVGVRVEKGQLSSSSSSAGAFAGGGAAARASAAGGGASRLASALAGRGGTAGAAGAGSAGGGSAGAAGGGAAGGGAAGGRSAFLSGAFGGGNSSFGTVSSINGKTIFVTQAGTGNVVKVTLSSATKITKNVGVGKSAIRPGDTVVVTGLKGSNGKLSATSVSDTGASATGSGAGSSSSSGGSSGSASSAVSSLFGGG
jgi:Domain of unknown function (DUF5666)